MDRSYLPFFGQSLRAVRKARGLQQQQLAALSGIPGSTFGGMEVGKVSPHDSKAIERILVALSATPAERTHLIRAAAVTRMARALADCPDKEWAKGILEQAAASASLAAITVPA